MSQLEVNKVIPQSGTTLTVGEAGDTVDISNATLTANINASSLTSGTIPDARFPATLPAVDGSLLTNVQVTGGYVIIDPITVTNTDTFALTSSGSPVSPASASNCIVSVNGVVQAPLTSYTISGSNIVFASALSAGSDVIDFITVLGSALNVGTVSDGTIGLAKLSATGTKDATTFLRGDNTFAEAGGGKVLQVIQAVKTDVFIQGSINTWSDVTGLSVSITPSSSSSKVLVMGKCAYSGDDGWYPMIKLVRDSTDIFIGDADGSRTRVTSSSYSHATNAAGTYYGMSDFAYNFLDSPATTSSTTYKIQLRSGAGNNSYINRPAQNDDNQFRTRGASSIIVMEISA